MNDEERKYAKYFIKQRIQMQKYIKKYLMTWIGQVWMLKIFFSDIIKRLFKVPKVTLNSNKS